MDPMLAWGLGLIAVALVIVVIEAFVPSMGILTLTAITVAVAGVVCLFRKDTAWGVAGTLVVLVAGPTLLLYGLKLMPSTPIGRRLVLSNATGDEEDGDAPPPQEPGPDPALLALVGREGVVASDLRPIGSVKIDGRKYEARSEMGMLRAGAPVRVTAVEGGELRVRAG